MRATLGVAVFAALLTQSILIAFAQDTPSGVDLRRSHATFGVTHLYLTRVSGSVPIDAATVVLGSKSTVPLSVSATLDAKRIDSGDADRDADLQGPDWFDTKQYSKWTFASSSVTAKSDTTFSVTGTLTVHGVAQAMTLDVITTRGFPHPAYHAVGHVDRHGFGMRGTPTDALIGSDVTIALDVETR